MSLIIFAYQYNIYIKLFANLFNALETCIKVFNNFK